HQNHIHDKAQSRYSSCSVRCGKSYKSRDACWQGRLSRDQALDRNTLPKLPCILCSSSGRLQKWADSLPQLETSTMEVGLHFPDREPGYLRYLFVAALMKHLQDKHQTAILIERLQGFTNSPIELFTQEAFRRRTVRRIVGQLCRIFLEAIDSFTLL